MEHITVSNNEGCKNCICRRCKLKFEFLKVFYSFYLLMVMVMVMVMVMFELCTPCNGVGIRRLMCKSIMNCGILGISNQIRSTETV